MAELEEIKKLYEKLKYVQFDGKHMGNHNHWDLIDVATGDPFCELLKSIQDIAKEKVWKGFTNSDSSVCGLNWKYRLFIELSSNSFKSSTKFRITHIKLFESSSHLLKKGFAMTVEAVV